MILYQFISASKGSKKTLILLLVLVKRNNGTKISKAVLLLLKSVDKSFLPYAGKLFSKEDSVLFCRLHLTNSLLTENLSSLIFFFCYVLIQDLQ